VQAFGHALLAAIATARARHRDRILPAEQVEAPSTTWRSRQVRKSLLSSRENPCSPWLIARDGLSGNARSAVRRRSRPRRAGRVRGVQNTRPGHRHVRRREAPDTALEWMLLVLASIPSRRDSVQRESGSSSSRNTTRPSTRMSSAPAAVARPGDVVEPTAPSRTAARSRRVSISPSPSSLWRADRAGLRLTPTTSPPIAAESMRGFARSSRLPPLRPVEKPRRLFVGPCRSDHEAALCPSSDRADRRALRPRATGDGADRSLVAASPISRSPCAGPTDRAFSTPGAEAARTERRRATSGAPVEVLDDLRERSTAGARS